MTQWPLIILAYLSLFALGICDNLRGPLFPEIIQDFKLADGAASWFFALSSTAALVGSLVIPRWVQKFGQVAVLRSGLVLMAGAMIGMGLAPHYALLLVATFVFGFGLGVVGVMQNTLVTVASPAHLRGQLLSGLHSMYGLASVFGPLLIAGLFARQWPWSWALYLVATVPLGLALASYTVKSQLPAQESTKRRSIWLVDQVWFGAMIASYVAAEIMLSTRLALYMQREMGLTAEKASLFVSYFFAALLAGRFLFAVIRPKHALKVQLYLSLIGSLTLLGIGLFWGWPWALALCGFTMAPFYPLAVAYISHIFPERMDGAITTVMALQSFAIVVMHLSVGYLTEALGIRWAMAVGPLGVLISLILLTTARRVVKHS